MNSYLYLNGRFIGEDAAGISPLSRGLQYGEGLFETIRVKGKIAEYLSLHLKRLREGAKLLGISIPRFKPTEVIANLIRKNSITGTGKLKILVFTGRTKRSSNICITIEKYKPPSPALYRDGAALFVGRHPARASLACAKTTSYLPYLLSKENALRLSCFDTLLIGDSDEFLECSTANVSLYRDGCFYIPEGAGRLRGIMERVVIETVESQGVKVKTLKLTIKSLRHSDAAFITNSLIGVLPVVCIGKFAFKNKRPQIIQELINRFGTTAGF